MRTTPSAIVALTRLADQPQWHRGSVPIDLDRTEGLHATDQFTCGLEGRPPDDGLQRMRLSAPEALDQCGGCDGADNLCNHTGCDLAGGEASIIRKSDSLSLNFCRQPLAMFCRDRPG